MTAVGGRVELALSLTTTTGRLSWFALFTVLNSNAAERLRNSLASVLVGGVSPRPGSLRGDLTTAELGMLGGACLQGNAGVKQAG